MNMRITKLLDSAFSAKFQFNEKISRKYLRKRVWMEARVGWIVALTSPVVKPSGIWKMVMMVMVLGMMIMPYGNDGDDGDDGGDDQQMVWC